ncbi:YdeI/OmpD-associated family protein [Hymenobacter sp. BT770]|uniref:YdeI/OmpD-associated family protein n=1 Tax=Hymenobacter sp. BT770 TaxID=2886942 RepID=UPI001D12C650|nr:YdeI/OmpD-associated family protein [Hymenobacter sp. BT770]MCC3154230.1 YdeI/OmpD-associated family protein [Hymenobacter sp. BT770]MDO3416390.1 YdeI/OmpD-associated family protein [Hymenobacter sp. BT770]
MQPEYEFEAILEAGEDHGGVFVVVPFNVAEVYGTRGRVPVQATFDNYPYQGSIVPIGDGHHALLLLKQIRRAIDKTVGDTVRVTLSRDVTERKMEAPADLAEKLATNPKAAAYFAKLAYTHQREFVRWLEGAKKPETRTRRLEETVELLTQGRKRG